MQKLHFLVSPVTFLLKKAAMSIPALQFEIISLLFPMQQM